MGKRRRQNIATLAEQRSAKVFLRLIHASTANNLLVLAVIAWMRVSGRLWDPRQFARRLLDGTVYTPVNTLLGRKHELDVGALNAGRLAEARMYKLVLSAARHGHAPDFLVALAMTRFDPRHYGVKLNATDPRENKLLSVYSSFTGLALPVPPQPKAPKPRKLPHYPRALQPPVITSTYLDPYAAQRFYAARHFRPSEIVDGG